MYFHGGFGDAHVAGNLLVEAAFRNLKQYRALPRCQHFESRLDCAQCFFAFSARTVPSEPKIHRIQKILVSKRLREKLDGPALHRLNGHRNIAMSSDEDDRQPNAGRSEVTLKI